jgi:hypothetical protein
LLWRMDMHFLTESWMVRVDSRLLCSCVCVCFLTHALCIISSSAVTHFLIFPCARFACTSHCFATGRRLLCAPPSSSRLRALFSQKVWQGCSYTFFSTHINALIVIAVCLCFVVFHEQSNRLRLSLCR